MNARGRIASALFTALCLGGILTLFSQSEQLKAPSGARAPSSRSMTLNPAEGPSKDFGDIVPMVLERGAALTLSATEGEGEKPQPKLRLK
jgi:hypothetical protein